MAYLADSIWVNVSTSGTADFTTTTALSGYRTFADASAPNGSTIHYSARSATQFENGEGIYSSGTGIVTRATIFASSSAGAKVNFSVSPTLVVAPLAEDFGSSALTIGTTTITGGTTKHVLYDLAGEVEEAANFTIESGNPNVASGSGYLYNGVRFLSGVTADSNLFVGESGNFTMTGTFNVAIGGGGAFSSNTSGGGNVAIGTQALQDNLSGNNNVAVGNAALQHNTTAADNIGIGVNAVRGNAAGITGVGNVGIGSTTMINITSATNNTGVGYVALAALTTGTGNTGVGTAALQSVSTNDSNAAIGYSCFQNATGVGNTGVGAYSGYDATSADFNTIIGCNTGRGITTGDNNTIIGAQVSGLAAGLANSIVIADGAGNIKLDYNKTTASVLTLNADTAVLGTLRLQGYTIAGTLPAAGTAGRRAYVTNSAASPAFMATLTGGGSTVVPVFDDGTNWRYG